MQQLLAQNKAGAGGKQEWARSQHQLARTGTGAGQATPGRAGWDCSTLQHMQNPGLGAGLAGGL